MASILTLDRTQPEVDQLVSSWKNGQTYELRLQVRQDSSDEAAATFRVMEVEEMGMEEESMTPKKAPKTMSAPAEYPEES